MKGVCPTFGKLILLFVLFLNVAASCGESDEVTPNKEEEEEDKPIENKESLAIPTQFYDIYPDGTANISNYGTSQAFNITLSAQKNAVGLPLKIVYAGDDPIKNVKSVDIYDLYYNGKIIENICRIGLNTQEIGLKIRRKDGEPILINDEQKVSYYELSLTGEYLWDVSIRKTDNESEGRKLYGMWTNNDFLSNVVITKISSKNIEGQVVFDNTIYKINK